MNEFHEILSKLASLHKAVKDKEKASELIRALSEHFATIAMMYNKLSYGELLTTILTRISRRKAKSTEGKGGICITKASAAGATNKNLLNCI